MAQGCNEFRVVTAGKSAIMLSFSGDFRRWFESMLSLGDTFYIDLVESSEDSPHRLRFGVPRQVEAEMEDPQAVPSRCCAP